MVLSIYLCSLIEPLHDNDTVPLLGVILWQGRAIAHVDILRCQHDRRCIIVLLVVDDALSLGGFADVCASLREELLLRNSHVAYVSVALAFKLVLTHFIVDQVLEHVVLLAMH